MNKLLARTLTVFMAAFSLANTGLLRAESLDVNEAKNAATGFFLSGNSNGMAKAKMRSDKYLTLAADNQNGYYIFNRQDGGIVIVADDDALGRTVLGYTTEGTYDPENLPLGLQDWFSQISVLMDAVHAGKIDRRESLSTQQGDIVVDALITAKWGQVEPFYNLCPIVRGQHCPTGCTATAMAQVMNYWKWPEHGYGSVEYTAESINQNLSIDLSKSYYEWDNMLDKYTSSWDYKQQKLITNYTDLQANAVATLMRDCGYSVQMNYGLEASGANVYAKTLIENFNYSPLAENVQRDDYPFEEWHQMLQNELDNKRPVLYSGYAETIDHQFNGHQFVLDGYDTKDFYHVNWGWGGSSHDGWYILTDLHYYNNHQRAIIGVEPIKNYIPNYTEEPFSYNLTNGVLTINGSGMMPEEYRMETAPWRNQCQEIKKIVIGEGIVTTAINFGSFYSSSEKKYYRYDNLQEVVLPEGLLIIDYGFLENCPIQSIKLPSTLQRFKNAFLHCQNLQSLHLPKSLKIFDCTGLHESTEITIDAANPYFTAIDNALLNKEGTKMIMSVCSHQRLVIPEIVTELAQNAVYRSQASIIVAKPMNAPVLPEFGFDLAKNVGVLYIKEGATGYDSWLSKMPEGWILKTYTDVSQIPSGEFSWSLKDGILTINGSGVMPDEYTMETAPWRDRCLEIKKIILGDGILGTPYKFGYYFGDKSYRFENLEEVVLPEGMLFIEDYFAYSSPLQEINLPSSLQRLHNGIISCVNIKSLHLPKSLKEFQCNGISGLAEITVDEANPYFMASDNVLLNKEGTILILAACAIDHLIIPETVTEIYQSALNFNLASTIIAKPMVAPKLPTWGRYFTKKAGILYTKKGATGYEEWLPLLPKEWKIKTYTDESQIPAGEFSWSLKDSILTINGAGAMPDEYTMETAPWRNRCLEIKKIVIGEGILSTATNFGYAYDSKEYPNNIFQNLEEIVLPEGLLIINDRFIESAPIQHIDLPSTLQEVNNGFYNCPNLKNLHLPKSLKQIQCTGLTSLKELTIDEANPYFIVKDNVLLNKEETKMVLSTSDRGRLTILENITEISPYAINNSQASVIVTQSMTAPTLPKQGFRLSKEPGILYIKAGATGYEDWLARMPEDWTILTYTDESQIASGEFSWTLEDGILTINGSGLMPDEYALETAPWRAQCQDIKKIILREGILSTTQYFGYYYNLSERRTYYFENLEEIVLPEGLLMIENSLVESAQIPNINLPSTLLKVKYGFENCLNLTSIHLPKSLKEIHYRGSTGLVEITLDEENPYFTVKDNVLLNKEGTKMMMAASGLNRLFIPETVTEIATNAFEGSQVTIIVAKSMTAPTLPDLGFYLSKQTGYLFVREGATGYEEWLSRMPEGWEIKTYTNEKQIPSGDFDWTLEEGILSITGVGEMPYSYNNRPFADNSSTKNKIKKIKIGEGCMSFGWAAFWGLGSTKEIELPSTMKEVLNQSFGYSGITKIVCLAKTAPQVWGSFANMQENGVLQVLKGCDYSSWLAALPSGWAIEEIDHPLIGKIDNLKDYLLGIDVEGVNIKELDANKDGKLSVSDATEMVRLLNE